MSIYTMLIAIFLFTKNISAQIAMPTVVMGERDIDNTLSRSAAQGVFKTYIDGVMLADLPEHTWALGVAYPRSSSNIGLNLTAVGGMMTAQDDFYLKHLDISIRLQQNRQNIRASNSPGPYINFSVGYALADLTALYLFSYRKGGVLQVKNLPDHYKNDYYAGFASLGRQMKFGGWIRTN